MRSYSSDRPSFLKALEGFSLFVSLFILVPLFTVVGLTSVLPLRTYETGILAWFFTTMVIGSAIGTAMVIDIMQSDADFITFKGWKYIKWGIGYTIAVLLNDLALAIVVTVKPLPHANLKILAWVAFALQAIRVVQLMC